MSVENALTEIGPVDRWPPDVRYESIEDVGDIFYQRKLWKLVDKGEIRRHIDTNQQRSIFWNVKNDVEAYPEDRLLIGFNPFATDTLYLARTVDAYRTITAALAAQRDTYEARVSATKTCVPREWFSYGSEKEVDEARVETTREKISVEWMGNLEKRYEGVNFGDVEPEYVEFVTGRREFPKIVRKDRLDVGVQVSVRFRSGGTQTDTYEIAREFADIEDAEAGQDTRQLAQSGSEETPPPSADTPTIRYMDDVSLNYSKSFINMDKRTKRISSIAWHPVKLGYMAIAYVSKTRYDPEDHAITAESGHRLHQPITRRTRKTISENDIELNDPVFNVVSRKRSVYAKPDQVTDEDSASESESIKDDSEDEENEDETNIEDRFDTSTYLVYNEIPTSTSIPAQQSSPPDPMTSEFNEADLKWASNLLHTKESKTKSQDDKLLEDDISSGTESVDSIDSESSLCSTVKSEPPLRAAAYEDTRSEDSDSVEDDIPITDTDSSVLLWDCNNDLTPELNLYNVHDVNIVKFYPLNGNLLAGGSRSGQLVVWDIHDHVEKSKHQHRYDRGRHISEFMENLPGWEVDDSKCPLIHPVAVSKRNISHVDDITNIEWIHPSLKISSSGSGTFVKTESGPSKELVTSSLDGSVKVWQIHSTRTSSESGLEGGNLWELQLIYHLLVTMPTMEKYSLSVQSFKISIPPAQYVSVSATSYEFVPEINKKFASSILLANTIGEVGVIKFPDKKDAFIDGSASKSAENCKHEWWAICHDHFVSSLSQNYFFPHIALSTGGRIFALWKVDFKNGPIWWQQYPADVSLTDGCFTPFHPGILYIARSDGVVDLWNLTKQVHEPVLRVKASGYRIDAVSVITPPSPKYQISVADSNGILHILNNRYDTAWNDDDFKSMERFFKRTEECKKQLLHWNKHWKESSTTTDQYGFQYKPEPVKKATNYSIRKKPKHRPTEPSLPAEKLIEPTEPRIPFLRQICESEEIRTLVDKILDDLRSLPAASDRCPEASQDEPESANVIRNLYTKCIPPE